ncbi:hypothetical protein [Clostridium aciditolerans]|uniref:DUF7922 domain-containing protein n=1 Tax=Clostridium aciditolerans TaxID=339861 RepID=A0A934M3K6_9CLOT|nr:hypothetical protein [Clostridium aciditolerans]MBI6873135.1 hypothetical protein [Clostridium aciditolerans]
MVQKKSYSRYFIILQEDEKGYSISSDKVVSGYAKLEVKNEKCKISYYVQNLKKELAPYYMMLICNKKEVKKIIKIGEMNIDDYGRADICYEYPMDNVSGSGISVDKVSGAAIVKLLDNNILGVMSGFASTEIPNWKSFAVVEDKARESREEVVEEPKSIFDKYEESIEAVKLSENKESIIENNEAIRQDESEEVESVVLEECAEQPRENKNDQVEEHAHEEEKQQDVKVEEFTREEEKQQDVEAEELTREEERQQDIKEENIKLENEDVQVANREEKNREDSSEELLRESKDEAYDYPRGSTGDFFRNLIDGFEEITDMASDIKRAKWYRVSVDQVEDMYDASNYNRYTILYYPMISYYPYFRKHGHYVIGYKCDKQGKVKYLVYGIPGTRGKEHQPYGGKTGFVTWVPAKSAYGDRSDFGYWLMFYDFRTSTIVVPVKK